MTKFKSQQPSSQKNLLNFFAKTPSNASSLEAKAGNPSLENKIENFVNDTTPNNDSMLMEGTPIEGKPEFHSDMDAQVVTSIALLESVTSRQEDVPQLADLMNLSEGPTADEDVLRLLDDSVTATVEEVAMQESSSDLRAVIIPSSDELEKAHEEIEEELRAEQANIVNHPDLNNQTKSKRASKKSHTKELMLTPEAIKKIDLLENRMQHFVNELQTVECEDENGDTCLFCEEAIQDLLAFACSPSEIDEPFLMQAVQLIRNLITRSVHGSALPLSSLVVATKNWISKSLEILASTLDNSNSAISENQYACVKKMLIRLQDEIELSEEIKLLAVRTCFGVSVKACNPFEEVNPKSVFRWEAISTSSFPEEALSTIKEVKATRTRYGKLISSISKVVEMVSKHGDISDAKIAELESRVSKLVLELEKSKEKKFDADRKRETKKEEDRKKKEEERLRREAEKIKKEQEKEAAKIAKQQEKEEAIEKKRNEQQKRQQEKKAEADEKAREKEREATLKLKKQEEQDQVLEKQKNFFKNFLRKANGSAPNTQSESKMKTFARRSSSITIDEEGFENAIHSQDQTISDIVRYYKEKYNDARGRRRTTLRKPKILYVSVSSSSPNANEFVEGFYETKAVKVDSRMKTLRFYTDERPPYVGTFSKRSSIISGRKPFAQDPELFNYDYDSEAEWEAEEEDGEDIENSIGSDDEAGEGDDLQYDEFFLKDNDFGSDADSDGEDMAATLIRSHRMSGYTVEVIGLQFLPEIMTKPFEPFGNIDRDESTLRSYVAVTMSPKTSFPSLGQIVMTSEVLTEQPIDAILGTENAATTILTNNEVPKDSSTTCEALLSNVAKPSKHTKKEFMWSDDLLFDLIKIVHGKKDNLEKFESLFQEKHPEVPKTQIRKKILDISKKERHPLGHGSLRYMVKSDFLLPFGSQIEDVQFTPKSKKRKRPSAEQQIQAPSQPAQHIASEETTENRLMNEELLASPIEGVLPLDIDLQPEELLIPMLDDEMEAK